MRIISEVSWNAPGGSDGPQMLETSGIPRVEDVGAGHLRVREDRGIGVGPEAVHDPRVRPTPGEEQDRRVHLLDRAGRVAQRLRARLVRPDLVAGHPVVGERQRHRRRAPVAVVAVVVALPLADPAHQLGLEAVRRVALAEVGEDDLDACGRTPGVLLLVGEDRGRVAGELDIDRLADGIGVGVGVGSGVGVGVATGIAEARPPDPSSSRLAWSAVGVGVAVGVGGRLRGHRSPGRSVASSEPGQDRPGTGRPSRRPARTGGRHRACRSRSHPP